MRVMLANVTVFCFFASYLVALGFEGVRAGRGVTWYRWPAAAAAAAGLVAHTMFLLQRAQATNLFPLLSSTRDWLFVVAWVAAALYLLFTTWERRAAVGLFLLPLVLLLVGVGWYSQVSAARTARLPATADAQLLRGWVLLHAALLGIGIAAVVLGMVFSLMYLVQHHRLRTKRISPAAMKLLSLERLARWNRAAVLIGVPLLGLGFAVGFLLGWLAQRQGESVSFLDPVVIASSTAWVAGLVILGRVLRDNRPAGKAVALRTLLAFGILLGTLLGLQLVTGGDRHAVNAAQAGDLKATP